MNGCSRKKRYAEYCWRSKDELISDVLLWTTRVWWTIATDGMRESNESLPLARFDVSTEFKSFKHHIKRHFPMLNLLKPKSKTKQFIQMLLCLDCSTLPLISTLYCWVLSKEISNTIFKVFGMTRHMIEPRSLGPLANTLPTRLVVILSKFVKFLWNKDEYIKLNWKQTELWVYKKYVYLITSRNTGVYWSGEKAVLTVYNRQIHVHVWHGRFPDSLCCPPSVSGLPVPTILQYTVHRRQLSCRGINLICFLLRLIPNKNKASSHYSWYKGFTVIWYHVFYSI